ncbi:MAG: hypothetical protein PVSMB7_02550 [Chloroflexota bacterium]
MDLADPDPNVSADTSGLLAMVRTERDARLRAEALQDAGAAFNRAVTTEQIAAVAVEHGIRQLHARSGYLALQDKHGARPRIVASIGYESEPFHERTRRVSEAQQFLCRPDITHDAIYISPHKDDAPPVPCAHAPQTGTAGSRASAAVWMGQDVIGCLTIEFSGGEPLNERGRTFLLVLARECGHALERDNLYVGMRSSIGDEQRRSLQLRAVADAALAINASADRDSMVKVVVEQAREIVGAHLVFLHIPSDEHTASSSSNRYRAWAAESHALAPSLLSALHIDGTIPTRLSTAELEGVMPQDAIGLSVDVAEPVRGVLVAPLADRDDMRMGVICAMDKVRGEFTDNDEAILAQLAHMALIAMDNARLREKAEAAILARDEFISSVSHDLKNPIVSIKGFAQMLRRQVERQAMVDPERVARGLENIDNAATRMTAMINDLTNTVRLHMESPQEPAAEMSDLVDVARRAAREQEHVSEGRAIVVHEGVPHLWGTWDTGRLERVLANLLSNAIKYSPDGGVVRLSIDEEEVSSQRTAVLAVQDSGIGIPPQDMQYIFTRYHRGGNVPSRVIGSGVGLAAVKEIVEQHGGTIVVESVEGKGSTFTVRLPVCDA